MDLIVRKEWFNRVPLADKMRNTTACGHKGSAVNLAPCATSSNLDVQLLVNQLTEQHDLRQALPILEALDAHYGHTLLLCLPPINEEKPFPITDIERLAAWLKRGEVRSPEQLGHGTAIVDREERAFGVLMVQEPACVPPRDFQCLAAACSLVLTQWRERRLNERAQAEKETIVRLCQSANAQQELPAVLADAYHALMGSVPIDTFVATVYNPITQQNVLSYSIDAGELYVDTLVGPVPNSLQGHILREREPLHFADLYNEIQDYPDIQIMRFGHGRPMRAWLGVPLLLGDGRAVGLLSIQHTSPNMYSERDRCFLQEVAVPVAIAIEKAMLLQQRDREISVLTAQTELSEALGHARDIRSALESALTAIQHSFSGHAHLMYILNEQRRVEASILNENGHVYRDEGVGDPLNVASLSNFIMQQPKPVLFTSEQAIIEAGIEWSDIGDPEQPSTETVIGAALHSSDGCPMGLISVQSYDRNAFDHRQAALLGSIARQVALVVENARLIERDKQRLRALELANRELELAQHRVVEAERRRAIGDIAAGVAHDFNNLLGAILGNAQLIAMAEALDEAQEMASTIEIAARDAATIVRRIQEFTRARGPVERSPVDVQAMLRSAVDITRPKWRDVAQLRGSTINLEYDYQPVETVLGVESELREVVVNLIVNAVDALDNDGTITLGCQQHGGFVHIFVRDTGMGMHADTLARAGQPFFSTKGSNGSGLGLAVSQGIIQRHGGELIISSIQGQGTTVTLQLPSTQPAIARSSQPAMGAQRVGTIVLVEDDPHLRVVTQRALEQAGHIVQTFSAGPDALEHLSHTRADILLTDLGLPGMSGWEVAAAAQTTQPALRILLVTGWGDRIASEDAQRAGVTAVLSKPLEQRELLEAVHQALS